MWNVRLPRLDVLPDELADRIERAALTLLEEVGCRFAYPPALRLFRQAGAELEGDVVRLDRGLVARSLELAPPTFRVRGRDPARSVEIGSEHVAIAPTGGAPFVLDPERGRHPPTAEDHRTFVRLTQAVPQFHLNEAGIVEPDDLPVTTRHLDMDYDVLRWSDKPFFPVGASAESSRDSVEMAAIAFGGREAIAREPVLLGIVNPISPLQYDERMAGSLMSYAQAGQPVVLMPFVFTGGTAPVGLAGALAQTTAEVLAGITLVQLVQPGTPCVYGSSISELDLRDGRPRFATAGHGLAMLASGQIARRLGLPFRGGGGFTASPVPDARAIQESLMALWPALLSGANVILHAAGWLEGSLVTSIEKLAQDVAALEVFERLLEADVPVDEESLALDALREVGPGGNFLGAAHTLRNLRRSSPVGGVGWRPWQDLLDAYEDPGIDSTVDDALRDYLARRKREARRAG